MQPEDNVCRFLSPPLPTYLHLCHVLSYLFKNTVFNLCAHLRSTFLSTCLILVSPIPEHFSSNSPSILHYQYRYQYLYRYFLINSTDRVDYLYSILYYQYLTLIILFCIISISPQFYTVTISLLDYFHQVNIKNMLLWGHLGGSVS